MDKTTEPQLHTAWAAPLAADIAAARSDIILTALSMHPPRKLHGSPMGELWSALEHATASGVDVLFVMPRPGKTHPATAMNLHAAERLLAIGCRYAFVPLDHLLHAKTAIIDGTVLWVGSGNWTAAASGWNHEAYLRAHSPRLAAQLRARWAELGFLKG
jgi:phosphatidylserine/phosphatidylglycerophosphate/cardiolipin synthase-like enzyme